MAGRRTRGDHHFVGRAHELEQIADACSMRHRARLVMVHGEGGLGKTTLCEQAVQQAESDGFVVGWGRCWPEGGAPPLWPWPDVLADVIGWSARQLTDEPTSGVSDRFTGFTAIAEALTERARSSPILIVLDDLHVADTAALLLTRFLARSLDRNGVVIVVTLRPASAPTGERERLLDDLERESTVIRLAPFGRAETAALLAAHGHSSAIDQLVPVLLRVSGGNPFLIVRAITGASSANVLAGVEHLIDDAVAALNAVDQHVLGATAILGTEVAVPEIAAVCDRNREEVLGSLHRAAASALVEEGPGGWGFTHDLVRRTVRDLLGPVDSLELHARAAALGTMNENPAAAARYAHHALAAAVRSDMDAARAVEVCREAARIVGRAFDHERAVALLEEAASLVHHVPASTAPADRPLADSVDVLLEWAEALLVCGRLADARQVFDRATRMATDPRRRARAALGLGGVWVNEQRGLPERARLLALLRSALDALPVEESGLRARLIIRLAAEAVYDGGPTEPVISAIEEARCTGEPRVIAEALSLCHHALLAPEHLGLRHALADELVRVATVAGDDLRTLFGLLWRGVDLLHAGDPTAARALADLRLRADAVGCRSVIHIVSAIDVMSLIREGRLADAEAAAERSFELGVEVGDADAIGYYGAHLLTIRWLQDRDAELREMARDLATSSTLIAPEFAFRATAAVVAARAGSSEEAEAMLAPLRDVAALPRSSTWLIGMVLIVEAAATLGDAALAAEAAAQIAPFADRPAMASLGVTCFGSIERALGLARRAAGDASGAVEHLERAVRANIELANRPMTAMARADLASALIARRLPGDQSRAVELLGRAAASADSMGMATRAETFRQRAVDLTATGPGVLRRDGERWIVDVDDRHVVLPDLLGVGYIGDLLTNPGRGIPAVQLSGGASSNGSEQPLLDREAVGAYRRRVAEIDERLELARRFDQRDAQVRRLEHEREALRAELASVLAIGGRHRMFVDSDERARTAVRKAIRRAIDVIAESDEPLGAELRATITTGRRCSYDPDPLRPRIWSVLSHR